MTDPVSQDISRQRQLSLRLRWCSHCAVVDPQQDIEPYVEAAAQKNMRITHIFGPAGG